MITLHHPAFKSFITYEEAEELLSAYKDKPGRFVIDNSCSAVVDGT
jgi:hypothetical protein